MELNPNHPVTQEVHDQWHKLCALALFILATPVLEITATDIEEFRESLGADGGIAFDTRGGTLTLRLVNGAEARRLAREEGGLPT